MAALNSFLTWAVNRVTIAAQSPMQRWRERPITDTPPILIVDGVWVQTLAPTGQTWTDRSGHVRAEMRGDERVALAVMGVWEDGRHEILHYEAADVESNESWSAVLAALKRRGLERCGAYGRQRWHNWLTGCTQGASAHIPAATLYAA
jgi:transposase-like protein